MSAAFGAEPTERRPGADAKAIGWGSSDGRQPTTSEDWEQIRRSVAMLAPSAWALRREQALVVLGALVECKQSGGA